MCVCLKRRSCTTVTVLASVDWEREWERENSGSLENVLFGWYGTVAFCRLTSPPDRPGPCQHFPMECFSNCTSLSVAAASAVAAPLPDGKRERSARLLPKGPVDMQRGGSTTWCSLLEERCFTFGWTHGKSRGKIGKNEKCPRYIIIDFRLLRPSSSNSSSADDELFINRYIQGGVDLVDVVGWPSV